MRSYSRCRQAVAVMVAVALALTCTAAAQAPRGASGSLKTRLLAHTDMRVQAQPMPGLRPDLDASPIIIPEGGAPSGTKEGELGWEICLYNSQNWCISDADNPGDVATTAPNGVKAPPNGTDLVLLENISTGVASSAIFYVIINASKIYKFVKDWWLKKSGPGTHKIGFAPGDGQCMGDWGYNKDATMGSCGSAHGIYYQLQARSGSGSFRMWDTYSKGDMIAAGLHDGTPLFAHSPEDWSTWTGIPVCYVNCD